MERPGFWLLPSIAVFSSVLFGVLVMAIHEVPLLLAFDRAALLALNNIRSVSMDAAMRGITVFGSPVWIGSFAVIVGMALLLRRDYRDAAQMLLASLGSWALMMTTRPLIGRDRPELVRPLMDVQATLSRVGTP